MSSTASGHLRPQQPRNCCIQRMPGLKRRGAGAPVDEVPELEHQRLLPTVEAWLRKERTADKAAAKQKAAEAPEEKAAPVRKDPFGGAGRHMAFYRGM